MTDLRHAWLQRVFANVQKFVSENMDEVRDHPELEVELQIAHEAHLARCRRVIVFRHVATEGRHEVFQLGYEGEALQLLRTPLAIVWAAWAAIDDEGKSDSLRASDFVLPGSSAADISVRRGLRSTALNAVRALVPELVLVFEDIRIEQGVLRYKPRDLARRVVTR